MTRRDYIIDEEVEKITNYFTGTPGGRATAVTAIVKRLLIKNDARLFLRGVIYEIKAKSLGAGVYEITLAPI